MAARPENPQNHLSTLSADTCDDEPIYSLVPLLISSTDPWSANSCSAEPIVFCSVADIIRPKLILLLPNPSLLPLLIRYVVSFRC